MLDSALHVLKEHCMQIKVKLEVTLAMQNR